MTSRTPDQQPGFTRKPRIADLMTPDHIRFVDSSFAAERMGDSQTALEYHLGVPMFTKSRHTYTLTQLAALAEEMTPWLWARWAAYQCTRAEDADTESGRITRAALHYAVQMFYDAQMQALFDEGGDPMDILKNVMGESWIYQQVCTYELGGLQEFLDVLADGLLAEKAGWARSWANARMRALRVEPGDPGTLVVTDLRTRRRLDLLDLGAGTLCETGGFLVGRLVPSGVTPELMFDTTPVVVDEETAKDVAASEKGGWITALTRAIAEGRLALEALESEDRELASDIPSGALIALTEQPADRSTSGRDRVARAAFRLLRDAAEAGVEDDDWAPYVAAAVLNPHAYADAQRKLVPHVQPSGWLRWADLAPEPAAGRLRLLVRMSEQKAA